MTTPLVQPTIQIRGEIRSHRWRRGSEPHSLQAATFVLPSQGRGALHRATPAARGDTDMSPGHTGYDQASSKKGHRPRHLLQGGVEGKEKVHAIHLARPPFDELEL
jgi:hypothetical protein